MDIEADPKILFILEHYCKKFYSAVLDDDEDFYEKYKSMDQNDRFNNFIYTIINDNNTFVKYHKLLTNLGCDKKELNKFFYIYFKICKMIIFLTAIITAVCVFNIITLISN